MCKNCDALIRALKFYSDPSVYRPHDGNSYNSLAMIDKGFLARHALESIGCKRGDDGLFQDCEGIVCGHKYNRGSKESVD